ncbi:uncharacterized protein EKO05_0003498 [Ascochyta rabiei]|uniref:uncharacterized protein n=1 Tax=Didymella rabiei TaxID=5454 RepID=UPI0021FB755C|nr:uncharacterized protein EKO05_0003498 [Ascochyta rabiei]UPX12968.1 hypothetical protein EKO05_0003498 [Ascochyta rabiei]
MSKVTAACTATPAPADKSTDEPRLAVSKAKFPRNVELRAQCDAAQHEVAELKSQLRKSEQTIESPRNSPPTVMTWLATTVQSRFQFLNELQSEASDLEQAVAVDRPLEEAHAKRETERQRWDAQMRIMTDVAQLYGIGFRTEVKGLSTTARTVLKAEVQRLLTHCLKNSEVVRKTTAAEATRILADRKSKMQQKEASIDESLKLREDRVKHQEGMRKWYKMVEISTLNPNRNAAKALSAREEPLPRKSADMLCLTPRSKTSST